jgi:voltage-gated potassium channel
MIRRLIHYVRIPDRAVRRLLPRRIRRMLLVPLSLILTGTVAYPLIEGPPWTFFDGMYMTVITLTTLGYGEIPQPLSRPGRVFTMFLSLGGIFLLFFIATEIIRSVVTGELRDLLGKEHMDDRLKHLEGHTIVCGLGRMGKIVCDELERMRQPFVAVDIRPQVGEWTYEYGIRIQEDATEDECLRHAGIERARALITVVGSDADNLYITLSARLLKPGLFIVARAEEEEAEAKLLKVGANKVISPYLVGGHRAVQAVYRPGVLHFMEAATRSDSNELQIRELRVAAGSAMAGQSIRGSRVCPDVGAIVAGVIRPNGMVLHAPPADTLIEPGATLIVIGNREQLEAVELLAVTPAANP